MKLRTIKTAAMLALAGAMLQNGCGGSGANTVIDTVSPTAATVIAGTVQTFTSTVTGSTTTTSQWSCTYVYTPTPTTSQPNPAQVGPLNCSSGQKVAALANGSLGTWTTTPTAPSNVLTYTAPTLTDFPNPIPTITLKATADANKNKTGSAVLALDTGIRTSLTPSTATVPTEITPAQQVKFTADFLNVSPANANPQWKVVQPVAGNTTDFPDGTTPEPQDVTCSPQCGTISAQGVFTAPAKQPTQTYPISSGSSNTTAAPTVYVLVWSSSDINHYAIATITLVPASTNPLTFTGIQPTTIPAGGVLQDVFLNAKNLLNTTTITFTPPGANQSPQVIPASNIFTIPITPSYCTPSASGVTPVVTCDASVVTRIRLTTQQLATAGTASITVNNIPDPSNAGQTKSISFPINLVYVSPALVSAVPDSYPQGTSTQFSTDGGYYGGGNSPIVNLLFDGQSNIATSFNARQFTGPLSGSQTNTPGLYPVSIVSNAPQGSTPPYPIRTTDVAVQPVFAGLSSSYFTTGTTTTPSTQIQNPPAIPFPAVGGKTNLAPSAVALNSTKGYAVFTDQAASAVQIVNLVPNPSLPGRYIPQMGAQVAVGHQPTGIAIDQQISLTNYPGQDLGVVVNSGDYTLTLLALPSGQVIGSPVSLAGLVQEPPGTTAPTPFSVGVDPITHYAIVAFANAFVGFVVDVNPNPSSSQPPCFVASQKVPCAIASVSMNTGPTPQVVMQPDAPLAYVTPGGTGVTSVVNLLLTNNTVAIAAAPNGVTCTNDVVTVTTPTANGLNPSAPGSVLIAGVSPAGFNGTYNVTSVANYTFTYTYNGASCGAATGGGGTVTYGNPYYTFSTSSTAAGGAINPITRMFAFADPNAATAAPQIGFISSLDQSVSSLYLTRGSCNTCTPIPPGAPEVGLRSVSWDPFTNVLVAYNPANIYNEISLINPGGQSAGGATAAYRIIQAIQTGQNGTGSYTPGGSTTPVTVFGPMVYDPKTNLVLVANAGSNTLTYLDVDPTTTFKPVNVQDLIVTSGGVANGQPPLASTPGAPNPLPKAVCNPSNPTNIYASCFPQSVTVGQSATARVLGQGFLSSGTPVVRLDGDSTGISITSSTDTELDVTIAASRLTRAHDFALDVVTGGGLNSNTMDLFAVGIIDLTSLCSAAVMPEAVAIDTIDNVGVVTNYGCNSISFVNLDASNAHNYGVPYGSLLATVAVGHNPTGVDVIPRLGYAVVANNSDASASIVKYGGSPFSASQMAFASTTCTTATTGVTTTNICAGLSPLGVTIDQDRALALVANAGGNSLSAIDLTPLLWLTGSTCKAPSGTTTGCTPVAQLVATSGPPTAIAVDPNRAEAVVTNIQNAGTTSVTGGLDVINLTTVPPSKTTTSSINSLTANPTGIVYDPAVSPALFYTASTQQNAIYTFDPDSGTTNLIRVGINPFSLAYNFNTGTMVSVNSTSNTSSVIDAVNAPTFATRATLGISSQSQFAVAIDQFTNTALVADQNNNRVLVLPMPK